jgi:AraC-like DNA-binding protein
VTGATVATTSSRALLAACRRAGMDTAALLADAGLTEAEVEQPEGRLRGEAVSALWRLALQRSQDPFLGLHAATAVPFGAYRVIDFLAASSPTVGASIVRVAHYFPLINSAIELRISESGEETRVAFVNPRDPAGAPRPYVEYALAVTVLHCRHATGVAFPLARVELAFPSPGSTAEYEAVFGCPAKMGSESNMFVLTHAAWQLPNQVASPDLLRTLEEHADRLLQTLRAEEVESAVARCLMEELRGGDPSLERIAKRLGMSPRTLQRRLRDEQSSFADVLDRTRKHFASCYLQERGLQLTEIAYLLGFSEQSAFTRAFQRWYGVSPTQYRSKSA